MATRRLRCWECGIAFYGRADAHYCGGACRQKAHRSRTRRRAAEKTVTTPQHSHALVRAQQLREAAVAACAHAEAMRRIISEARAKRDHRALEIHGAFEPTEVHPAGDSAKVCFGTTGIEQPALAQGTPPTASTKGAHADA